MKIKGTTTYVVIAGALVALYAFVRSGGYKTAQRDLSRVTGGAVPMPVQNPMTNPTTGEPTFSVRNPWANDPIFAPYPADPYLTRPALASSTTVQPPSTASFGVGMR